MDKPVKTYYTLSSSLSFDVAAIFSFYPFSEGNLPSRLVLENCGAALCN